MLKGSTAATSHHVERAIGGLAFMAFRAGEDAIAEARQRQQVLAHNQRVAAIRAQRARRRAAAAAATQAAADRGAARMARWLEDRAQLGE